MNLWRTHHEVYELPGEDDFHGMDPGTVLPWDPTAALELSVSALSSRLWYRNVFSGQGAPELQGAIAAAREEGIAVLGEGETPNPLAVPL